MSAARFKVVCISKRAFLATDELGRPRQPRPDEHLDVSLTVGTTYEVIRVEHGLYRLADDTGEDYLFPATMFRRLD